VDPFLTREELAAAQRELAASFPTAAAYAASPALYRTDQRGGCMRELPYLGEALNLIALHPEIMSFVERGLETADILLIQSLVWAKYPGVDNFEQPLHADYMNTTLLYPASTGPRDEVTFILYYQDVDEQLGPTYVVSTENSVREPLVPHVRPKTEYPRLYLHERAVHVRAGSLLIYHMGTFHRASAILSRDRVRLSHHFVYRAADAPAVGYRAWATYGLSAEMQRFVERASPRQREALGFPAPAEPYWTEETLVGIAERYSSMDMRPYVDAADLPPARKGVLRQVLSQPRSSKTNVTAVSNDAGAEQRQLAEYYALVTGIPASSWLPWISLWTNMRQ
jgi:ectoine hydroxylase-related dioxygenase (phytanoyl-CoA dioxygenase family)